MARTARRGLVFHFLECMRCNLPMMPATLTTASVEPRNASVMRPIAIETLKAKIACSRLIGKSGNAQRSNRENLCQKVSSMPTASPFSAHAEVST